MDAGVHGEVEITDSSACHVTEASGETDIESVSRSGVTSGDTVAVDFTADAEANITDVNEVFHHEEQTVYRLIYETEDSPGCACECIETSGCPVRHIEAENGAIILAFVASDLQQLREIIVDLKSAFDGVSLRRLTQSECPDSRGSLVFIDRDALTARQQEVLETAHQMGYFEHPRESNATEVAEALDINRSTFAEHLSAAQSKLLGTILDG
ncbi:helix-turn-helix domain-containing protein [Haloferax larsenii]|uniref:Uncharacterized protein n=1 Tax=Haloferax larsenii TaxID=302484 RepID=A0A1H7PD50_HALLR|nr:helix-turn-helix domain-containing protein [Haloferax larsenii]SEL33205.1 hypothetical protein SAMN04488691_10444 [Haloferax larsenii]